MKKVIIVLLCFILLSASVLLSSCSNKTNESTSISKNSVSSSSPDSSPSSKTFTVDELKKYDGQNDNPAYVAVNGIVYDVTNAKNWKNGTHENGIVAGGDLTDELADSPHGDSVLADLPVVGTLE